MCPACGDLRFAAEKCGCVIMNKGSGAEYEGHLCKYHEGFFDGMEAATKMSFVLKTNMTKEAQAKRVN